MSGLEIINCEQGSAEWHRARAGVPTASEFDTVMAKGRDGGPSKTRRTYMLTLIGQIATGEVIEGFSNIHTARGHALEPKVRELYAFCSDEPPVPVGFMKRGKAGASPDSLVGEKGLLEIKTKLPHLQLEVLLADEMPAEHKPQVQGQLWVAEREWVDFCSYWPGLPMFQKRVYRDEAYIKTIAAAVDRFVEEMQELMHRLQIKPAAPAVTTPAPAPALPLTAAALAVPSVAEAF